MKNNHYLVCSSFFLLIPFIYFMCNFKNNNFEIFLAFLLLFSFILSVLFWSNGEYKSLIHILDGIFSKTVAILFFLYIFLIKKEKKYSQLLPLIIFIIILILFYMSNKYSNNTWCSKDHIIIHSIFHLFSMIALLFAFI